MGPVKCCYHDCINTNATKSMFTFPINDDHRLKLWIKHSGNANLASLTHKELKQRYICECHFKSEDVLKHGVRSRLIPTAVPLMYKPVTSQCVGRFPLYSLFPVSQGSKTSIHKVTEAVFTTSVLGTQHSQQLDLVSQPLLLSDRFYKKMDETKLSKCVPEPLSCSGDQPLNVMQPLTIKTEQAKRACNTCLTNSPKKMMHGDGGCSRTNPVAWLGQSLVQVKREPQQLHMSELVAVKLEQASPGNKPDPPPNIPASLNNGSIPVGIAVARQRVDAGLLTTFSQQKDAQQRLHDIDGAQAAMTVGVASAGPAPAPLWPPPPAPQPLWQYPAQMSMDMGVVGSMGSMGGMGGIGGMGGYQLVREPSSGALLLLPAQTELSHAVVWGSLPYPAAPLLLPPPPPPAPHPMQLLPGDLLASTTLQHTHSTRLVTLAPANPANPPPDKRKPLIQPLHALIKLEPEPPQEKYVPEPPAHLYYDSVYPPELPCRSQATSPAAPPTPQPDHAEPPAHRDASNQTDHVEEEDDSPNQADEDEREVACVGVAHFPDDSAQHTRLIAPPIDSAEESSSEGLAAVGGAVEKAIDAIERDQAIDNSSSSGSNDLVIDTSESSPLTTQPRAPVDVSGLELLSNSIEQFERTTPKTTIPAVTHSPLTVDTKCQVTSNILIKCSPKSPPRTDLEPSKRFEFPPAESAAPERTSSLDGLGLLCALAEQRFMEEVEDGPSNVSSRPFIKSELLSPTDREPNRSIESKKERRRSTEGDSSSERRRKRSHDREERLRRKLEKMRRHRKEKENGSEIEAILKRVTACACGMSPCVHKSNVPSAQDIVSAIEKGMRERLEDLQRQCNEKKAQLNALTTPLAPLSTPSTPSTPTPSPDSDRGSSKKRKVGRPRKVSSPDSTETIVAKKPKSKSGLVGYLIAKGKLKGGIVCSKGEFSREDANRTSKVRPKLKAEPIMKVYSEEEDNEWGLNKSASSSMESLNEVRQQNKEKVDRLVRKHSRDDLPELELTVRRTSLSSESDKERRKAKKRRKSIKCNIVTNEHVTEPARVQQVSRCTLTEDILDSGPRVLTAMGGLFYAGQLSAVRAPDVYAITLDGERGNKPHILSREETLRDAIVEVPPSSVEELAGGTRVCAYWSQQYRCLYPGTVAPCVQEPGPDGDRFVAVEFDDGDSGRIAIEDIRFLEPNYPVVEYENPLFTLMGKRRRNTSASAHAHSADERKNTLPPPPAPPVPPTHRDRKKLKKHRKDKLKRLQSTQGDDEQEYIKKKKKKHKCCEDHCKHRKHHKKHHKKHRKRHHSSSKESNSSDEPQRKSSSEFGDSKSNEDSVDSNDRLSTLIAVEKSPEEKMKTVIKKAVLSKSVVKCAVLDLKSLGNTEADCGEKDNLKDSGIVLEDEPSTSEAIKKKVKRRTVSGCTETCAGGGGGSKMAAFLPGGALWRWAGEAYRRTVRPRHKKLFYRAIQRGEETLNVGECAVFLSTGRADRPYIGRLEALWEARSLMCVRVRWFYHPEETLPSTGTGTGTILLHYPGGLFESPHTDENDVQTISHKCEVLPLAVYRERMGDDPAKYRCVYDNNDCYYLAGHYDPAHQLRTIEPGVPLAQPAPTS